MLVPYRSKLVEELSTDSTDFIPQCGHHDHKAVYYKHIDKRKLLNKKA